MRYSYSYTSAANATLGSSSSESPLSQYLLYVSIRFFLYLQKIGFLCRKSKK